MFCRLNLSPWKLTSLLPFLRGWMAEEVRLLKDSALKDSACNIITKGLGVEQRTEHLLSTQGALGLIPSATCLYPSIGEVDAQA